jgi:hypothetical protein
VINLSKRKKKTIDQKDIVKIEDNKIKCNNCGYEVATISNEMTALIYEAGKFRTLKKSLEQKLIQMENLGEILEGENEESKDIMENCLLLITQFEEGYNKIYGTETI